MAKLNTEVQCICREFYIPEPSLLKDWAEKTYIRIGDESSGEIPGDGSDGPVDLTIRIVDEEEGAELNLRYRKKAGATNVLAFPYEGPKDMPQSILGDIVICAPVVAREAQIAGTSAQSHWAHLVVHGILHLCGFDHKTHRQAEFMEILETSIMRDMGFPDPYFAEDG